jgi:uncharacterized membrane protein YwzB
VLRLAFNFVSSNLALQSTVLIFQFTVALAENLSNYFFLLLKVQLAQTHSGATTG